MPRKRRYLDETEVSKEANQVIKDKFTVNGVTYGTIPSHYTKGKIANSKTKNDITSDRVYVRQGDDGKWYQTRMDKDANNINYYLDNKALIDRSNEIIESQSKQGIGHKIEVDKADARARQQWFSNEDATKFLLTTAGLSALGGGLISAPLATTLGLAGGYGGGKLVDKAMQATTGKTWSRWLSDKTKLPEWFSEFTNPGTVVGGGFAGAKGYKYDKNFLRPLIEYSKRRGTWYSPIEYSIAHSPVGKRAIYAALNTTEHYNPIPKIKEGIGDMISIKESSYGKQKAKALFKYILTGKGSKLKLDLGDGKRIIDPTSDEGFYTSFGDTSSGGFVLNKSKLTPKKQLIFDTGLDPRLFTEVGRGEEHGVLTNYTHNINPQYKNARVFEGNPDPSSDKIIGPVKSVGIKSADGGFNLYDKQGAVLGYYNGAGHVIEQGVTADGIPVARSIDIYKFNPKDYTKKWIDNNGNKYNKLLDFGLNTVEEATKHNVPIVRTPWYKLKDAMNYDTYYIYNELNKL